MVINAVAVGKMVEKGGEGRSLSGYIFVRDGNETEYAPLRPAMLFTRVNRHAVSQSRSRDLERSRTKFGE